MLCIKLIFEKKLKTFPSAGGSALRSLLHFSFHNSVFLIDFASGVQKGQLVAYNLGAGLEDATAQFAEIKIVFFSRYLDQNVTKNALSFRKKLWIIVVLLFVASFHKRTILLLPRLLLS